MNIILISIALTKSIVIMLKMPIKAFIKAFNKVIRIAPNTKLIIKPIIKIIVTI